MNNLDKFQTILVNIPDTSDYGLGIIKFANNDFQAEQYVINLFTNYANDEENLLQVRQGIFYDVNDLHDSIKEGCIIVRKNGNAKVIQLYKIAEKVPERGWFGGRNNTKKDRMFLLQKTATLSIVDSVDSPYIPQVSVSQINIEKQEMISEVKNYLNKVEKASGRENKRAICEELFKILCTKEGMRFVHNHFKFKETVRDKLIEFMFIEKLEEAHDFYEQIFNRRPTFIDRNLLNNLNHL